MNSSNVKPFWNVCRRVYLIWAIIIAIGFIATHFHQLPDINNLWLVLSAIGLGYMFLELLKMRFASRQLLNIGLVWLLTISFGLFVSIFAFSYEPLAEFTGYLGVFWLLLMGVGKALNAIVNRHNSYLIIGGLEVLAGLTCYWLEPLASFQYLAAGILGSIAMLALILTVP
jgi:hypothetical protein